MAEIEAKQAIIAAKSHVASLFDDEMKTPPTLEEIWLDEKDDAWCVTLGVRRPSNHIDSGFRDVLTGAPGRVVPDYKVVRISRKTGHILSVRNRELVRL